MQMTRTESGLVSAFEQLSRLIRRLSTAGDLSLPAALVLARLTNDGPQRLTGLAAREGISQPAMTQLVTRMQRDGYVCRTADADDRRAVLVEATDAGRALVRRRRAERAAALRGLLARLDPDERAAIRAALPALNHLVELDVAGDG